MMTVEQVKDSIRHGDTHIARADVVAQAQDELRVEAVAESIWRKEAMMDARDALACGDTSAAWTALTRHEA